MPGSKKTVELRFEHEPGDCGACIPHSPMLPLAWDSPWPSGMTTTSLQRQSTLLCILPRQGLPSTPPHVSNFPLPGVACDPIFPPLMNLINLIPSALQVPLRVAQGPSPALCRLSRHLSSQQLPRQQLSATEPHSPDDLQRETKMPL